MVIYEVVGSNRVGVTYTPTTRRQEPTNCLSVFDHFVGLALNPFLTKVPLMQKPGNWFLLAKCLKNTCGRVTF